MHKGTLPIPEVFCKAILFCSDKEVRAIGFFMKNEGSTQAPLNFAVSIDKIREDTGFNLFYQLPDEIEERVEKSYELSPCLFELLNSK